MPAEPKPSALKESRKHGTFTFPCAFYRGDCTRYPADTPFVVKHHWHEEPEIIYCEQGAYQIEVNMQTRRVDRPCFCFVNGGELHHLLTCSPTYQEQAIVFSPDILRADSPDLAQEQFLEPLGAHRLALPDFLPEEHPAFPEVQEEFLKIRSVFYRENPNFPEQLTVRTAVSQLRVKASLLNLLASLGEHGLLAAAAPAHNPRIESLKKVLTYIQEHFQGKIYISDLAQLAGLNEQYFCRFFKKAIGKTPVAYINDCRIRHAAKLLGATDLPVTDVALECGFSNLGHFMSEFKKSTQLSPLQFRKQSGSALR